jgi:hypothetical protein
MCKVVLLLADPNSANASKLKRYFADRHIVCECPTNGEDASRFWAWIEKANQVLGNRPTSKEQDCVMIIRMEEDCKTEAQFFWVEVNLSSKCLDQALIYCGLLIPMAA